MPTYNKLVCNHIPELIAASSKTSTTEIMSDEVDLACRMKNW